MTTGCPDEEQPVESGHAMARPGQTREPAIPGHANQVFGGLGGGAEGVIGVGRAGAISVGGMVVDGDGRGGAISVGGVVVVEGTWDGWTGLVTSEGVAVVGSGAIVPDVPACGTVESG